jgi:hypothetical protein
MRLTEFADPKAYSLPAQDDAAVLDRHHQLVRPNGATDKRPPSPRRVCTLPPISPTKFLAAL